MHIEDITFRFINWKSWLLVLSLVAFPSASLATNHYVWCGATGRKTGADFTDAYTDLPVSLTRGDTYYVAGSSSCSYGAHTFNDALSETTVISILHATSAQSGVVGYASSMATTSARWLTTSGRTIWHIDTGYYVFNGEFGSVGTAEPTMGTFGFYLANSADGITGIEVDSSVNNATISNLTFDHIEANGGPLNITNLNTGSEAFFAKWPFGASFTYSTANVSFYEDYFHDWETGIFQLNAPSYYTVDHSWMARILFTHSTHGNGAAINPGGSTENATNLTFSNDTWEDICGTSAITLMNGTIKKIVIYGNTFFQRTNTEIFPGTSTPTECNGDGQIGDLGNTGQPGVDGAFIYNNTFYNCSTGGRCGVDFTNPTATNIVQTDNLFVNNENVRVTTSCAGCIDSYNTFINSELQGAYRCTGTGDSCQGISTVLSSASVTSNVADVVISSGHGLSLGTPVLVMSSQVSGGAPCGIDTYYPYPRVSEIVSSTEFKYKVQQVVPDARCQAGRGVIFASPITSPFPSTTSTNLTLSADTVAMHLNDGVTLPSPYNVDPNGTPRGTNGHWDRGAYQFLGAPLLDPPTHLTVRVE